MRCRGRLERRLCGRRGCSSNDWCGHRHDLQRAVDANLTILLPHIPTDPRGHLLKTKSYADLDAPVKDWTGNDKFAEIKAATA